MEWRFFKWGNNKYFNLLLISSVYFWQGGGYLVDLFDYYAAGWPYLFIGLCELIIVSYIYGIETFCDDLYHMVKFRPGQNQHQILFAHFAS